MPERSTPGFGPAQAGGQRMCVPHWNSEQPETPFFTKNLAGGAIASSDMMTQTMRVPISQDDRVKLELMSARARAVEVVTALRLQAQAAKDQGFTRADGRPDALRQVTGTSAIEAALVEANRVVEQYDRMLSQLTGAVEVTKADPVVLKRAYRVGPATIARTA